MVRLRRSQRAEPSGARRRDDWGFHGTDKKIEGSTVLPANATGTASPYHYDHMDPIAGEHRGNWAFYVPKGTDSYDDPKQEHSAWGWADNGNGRSRVHIVTPDTPSLGYEDDHVIGGDSNHGVGVGTNERVARSLTIHDTKWIPPHSFARDVATHNWKALGNARLGVQGTLPPIDWDNEAVRNGGRLPPRGKVPLSPKQFDYPQDRLQNIMNNRADEKGRQRPFPTLFG